MRTPAAVSGSNEGCKLEHISFTYARQKIRGTCAAVCITQSPHQDEPCRLAVRKTELIGLALPCCADAAADCALCGH